MIKISKTGKNIEKEFHQEKNEKEDPKNIMLTCPECSEKLYPHKGKLIPSIGQHAKLKFTDENGVEYMWVKVLKGNKLKEEYQGVLDNDPVIVKNVKYGDNVKFEKEDIYDVTIFTIKNLKT